MGAGPALVTSKSKQINSVLDFIHMLLGATKLTSCIYSYRIQIIYIFLCVSICVLFVFGRVANCTLAIPDTDW